MKVAIYTIAKNEAQFVGRWFDSAREADSFHILDTGSTDQTVAIAESLGVDVAQFVFDPWRFDAARNMALDMIPEDTDLCIALDMDEVLVEGWRDQLEAIADGVTRPRYEYTWSWEGSKPGLVYGGDKIHARHGYHWRHPVHEVITPDTGFVERQEWCGLKIHHHPDSSKSRGQYLPLLELAVAEDTEGDRNSHYLAREYFFAGRMNEAETEFVRHLGLDSARWGAERAQSCRYLYKITRDISWLDRAIEEAPERREPFVDKAFALYEKKEWKGCLDSALAALAIQGRPLEYLTEEFAWGTLPHDLAAIAAYKLGYLYEAKHHGMEAFRLSPYDIRLKTNYQFYLEAAP